jgi:pimeloyl-ACP methyl ester carboxylesterase
MGAARGVLLVPGFTGSKEDFLAILEPLHSAGIQSVAFDQVGQFESIGPDEPGAYGLSALAEAVVGLARQLWPDGPRPHLVGHSLGGLVARRAVIAAPAEFSSLTLLASGPAAIPEHRRSELEALRAALPETDLATVWKIRQEWERRNGAEEPAPEVAAFLRARWLANNPLALRAKALILLEEPDRCAQLAATGVPAAVVYGTDDDVWSPATQAAMARELGAVEVVVDRAGHSPAADQPRATAAALIGIWRRLSGLDEGKNGYDHIMTVPAAVTTGAAAPRDARRLVADRVAEWGLHDIGDDLRLIASELVTNALIHTPGPVEIGMSTAPDHVRIEVSDPSPVAPQITQAEPDDDHGRGLAIVASLSRAWGTDLHPGGKTVWAEVTISDRG